MWVLCEKFHADGSFNRTKARLVACENNSKYTVPDTWSPTVALSSVRLILDIAAHYGAHLLELDVSGAYLLGKRSSRSRVFLRLPPTTTMFASSAALTSSSFSSSFNFVSSISCFAFFNSSSFLWSTLSAPPSMPSALVSATYQIIDSRNSRAFVALRCDLTFRWMKIV